MNNYFVGGTGGTGGPGYGNGVGGAGGNGMGASLSCDFHGDVVVNNAYHHGERGIHILHRSVTLAAIYDSMESFPQPKCHPETRTRMLTGLRGWAMGDMDTQFETFHWLYGRGDPGCSIVWLYGPAGAGKSAIMQTLCGYLDTAGRLGGSFFFKRGHATRGNAKTLFATIAYQLALRVPWLRTPISEIVEHDPSIPVRTLEIQMRKLILEPCCGHENGETVTILIDGLDECDGMDTQAEILRIILDSSSQSPIPLRFIIASRHEAHIREMFDSPIYVDHHLSVNLVQSFDDVRKYLRDEFSRIHREHYSMKSVPSPWPMPDVLEKLVEKSSGHFIYASTIIRFVDDKSYRPTERLAVVQDPNGSGSESVFDTLDQLYMTILRSAPRQSQLIPIMCAIVHFKFRLEPNDIDKLFGLADGETRLILRGLHSMLDVPSEDSHRISSHHASFVDFLNNPDRSANFCVGILKNQIRLARPLLEYYAVLLPNLIHFIVSLPPSGGVAELFPLIGSINPHYIFQRGVYPFQKSYDDVVFMGPWLKNIPSAPADVIQLWEDYAFMSSMDTMCSTPGLSVKHIVSPAPELLRILISMWFLQRRLWELSTKLDLTCTDLRTTLCSLRSKLVGDKHAPPFHRPQMALSWVTRDLALQFIRKMAKNHIDTDGGLSLKQPTPDLSMNSDVIFHVSSDFPHLALCSISFPNSVMDLITCWQQAVPDTDRYRIRFDFDPDFEERYWHDGVGDYNDMIARLHLPDNLKFPL
ncbi:putative nwd2 protein [Mycena sanguinolenta]|uniref:Putative nwd2 protein n=1 Tax=Mycena sanguinolenta TaxID=230812 RepID=A0A8H6WY20_9AGAR|nr:putative nwd2 protein [Mycena sanguinolenta]